MLRAERAANLAATPSSPGSPVEFLDRFRPANRERILAMGHKLRLVPGQYLIRRGERGGDMFLVEDGALEVVDTRSQPEIVLGVVGPGGVVGEMAFVDAAPRGADVRASAPTEVLHFEVGAVRRILEDDPDLGVVLYAALAEMAVARYRDLVSTAVIGGLGTGDSSGSLAPGTAQVGFDLIARAREGWRAAESELRRGVGPYAGHMAVAEVLGRLVHDVCAWLDGLDADDRIAVGEMLETELTPYLGRARTGALVIDAKAAHDDAELRNHVIEGSPEGTGVLGEVLDSGLLMLPTCVALRTRQDRAAEAVERALPQGRAARVLFINPGRGDLLRRLGSPLAELGAQVTCIDADRHTLAQLDPERQLAAAGIELRLVQEDLARIAAGRSGIRHESVDVIIVGDLADSLPDRRVASLASWCRDRLRPTGQLVMTALGPTTDRAFVDLALGWPLIRRSERAMVALLEAEGLMAVPAPRSMPSGPSQTLTELGESDAAQAAGLVLLGRPEAHRLPSP